MPSSLKLTYAASSWWGFTTAEDRQRLEAVIRRSIRSGLCADDHMSLEDLVTDANDKLFNLSYTVNIMFYTVYFLVVQSVIIILGQGVIKCFCL